MADHIEDRLNALLAKARGKLALECLLLSGALIGLYIVSQQWIIVLVLLLLMWPKWQYFRKLTADNLLVHLDREFATLEDSSRLLIKSTDQLALLQRLQQQKIRIAFADLDSDNLTQCLPSFRYKATLMVLLLTVVFYLLNFSPSSVEKTIDPGQLKPLAVPSLLSSNITIRPPAYTGLATVTTTKNDLEFIEGSTVQWSLSLSEPEVDYQILINGEAPIRLIRQPNGQFTASKAISKTAIYTVGYGHDKTLPGVYSLSVNKDQPPKVRIVEPNKSLVELARSAEPRFTAKALVSDDFAISEVKILASVAKGSGEAVKFRDEVFSFDHKTEQAHADLYSKEWELKSLNMEPGDEVYFTVVASDNKASGGQEGRSGTVIVRWLNDEEAGIAAEGIVLNFVAEYFRSQRQIIIETEQLIADKADLSAEKFAELSAELGQAQGDLKQRYGQYLGDEFGEGPGDQLISNTPEENNEAHEEEGEHEHEHEDEHGHDEPGQHTQSLGKGSADEVLANFAHTHEDVFVGVVSLNNPKAMMKKAVSIMWDAELKLLMSSPEQALPYEQQAYKYLKLAKQAERIYVKRLGFVPPPVKENKRLTGELKDIHSYQRNSKAQQDPDNDDALFRQAFTLLNQLEYETKLTLEQRETLNKLKARLTDLAQERAGLIRQVAIIERLLLADINSCNDCQDILKPLANKLWQLIQSPISYPVAGQQGFMNADDVIADYVRKLQQGQP